MVHVTIIGAGLAGLSAAIAAVQQGYRVTVLEARRFAGGRAYAFRDPASQQIVDNGQHLLMGCYQSTFAYLRTIGAQDQVEQFSTFDVPMQWSDGRATGLYCPPWPAPLHFAAGVYRMRGFSRRDWWRLLPAAMALLQRENSADDTRSVAQWLDAHGQSAAARTILWEPLCLAVMNETLERASLAPLLAIMREGLANRRVPQGLAIPRVSLSQLFVDPALAWLQAHGVVVQQGVAAETLQLRDQHIVAMHTSDGRTSPTEQVLCALPPRELHALLRRSGVADAAPWTALPQWDTSPIVSVHLWYDRSVIAQRVVGLLDSPFHWAFAKDDISGVHCVGLVASAARAVAALPRAELHALAQREVAKFFPAAQTAQCLHVQSTRELHATPSLTPGSGGRRLGPGTPWPNLWLAGDWTNTGIPATIESAIRSGSAAIQALREFPL